MFSDSFISSNDSNIFCKKLYHCFFDSAIYSYLNCPIINSMKNLFLMISLAILFSFSVPLFADDLQDFKNDVLEEEEENSENNAPTVDENDDDESEDSPFLRFLWEITFLMWFIHNETVYYTPYPYEFTGMTRGNNFIGHDRRSEEEIKADTHQLKNSHFALYGAATINEEFNIFGGLLRFTGKFVNHMGPEIDYRILIDGKNLLHNLSAGLNISFFQFDFMTLDFYLEGAFFMGLMNRQGLALGAKITSYPFKPISLEVRSGGMFFKSITFAEIDVKLGFHINSMEIFGNFYTLQSENSQLYSIGIGAGVHF